MKLQDLVFTDGLATIRSQEFLLCITANGNMTYTIKKYSNNNTYVIAALASASRVQDTLDYYFPEPAQSHQPTPQTPEKGLNLSQSDDNSAQYNKYFKNVGHLELIDVYRTLELFGVTDHALGHAAKKILLCGVRTGGKKAEQEITEARDTLNRWLEMRAEDVDEMAFKHTLGGE